MRLFLKMDEKCSVFADSEPRASRPGRSGEASHCVVPIVSVACYTTAVRVGRAGTEAANVIAGINADPLLRFSRR